MCNDNRLAVRTFDHRCHDIPQVEAYLSQRMIFATVIYNELMQSARLCSHSRQRKETVTAVDVHTIGNRADTVSRVNITVTCYGMLCTPLSFGKSRRAHTQVTASRYIVIILSIVELHFTQVVFVTATTV